MSDDLFQVVFGQVVRSARKEKDFSQESFADQVGLHRTYIGAVERGETNITLHNMSRIANALRTPLSALILETEVRLRIRQGDR